MILAAGQFRYLIHTGLHNFRYRIVERVGRFTVLEVGICVLRRTALMRMFRIHRSVAECLNRFFIRQLCHVFVVDHFYFLDFVRSTEPIEEMQERNTGFQRGQMRHQRQVHNFLHRSGSQHRKPGLTTCHNVGLITEDVQSLRCQRTRTYMEYAGQQFAGNLVHVRDHQQQALGRGKRGGHSAGYQRAVHSTRCARFALHLYDVHRLAEDVLTAGRCPFIAGFRHRRRRRDRVDGCHIAERICNMRGSGIAINGQCLCHYRETSLGLNSVNIN